MLRYPRIILGFPSITLALSKQYSYRKALRASRKADRKASAHRRVGRKGRPASWKAGRKASGCLGSGSEGLRASRKAGLKASRRHSESGSESLRALSAGGPREAARRTIRVKLFSFSAVVAILYYRATSPHLSRVMCNACRHIVSTVFLSTPSGARWVTIGCPEEVQCVRPHSQHCVLTHATADRAESSSVIQRMGNVSRHAVCFSARQRAINRQLQL